MSDPLAVVYYSNLIPGSRLVARLQDMGYRVHTLPALTGLAAACEQEKPLLALIEISPEANGREQLRALRANPATQHIPVLAFANVHDKAFQAAAQEAGVSLLAASAAVLEQLPQLLDQALQVD
ncbi:MAG TPA: hypothetical protein VHB20_16735 [Verrucomicrobiae bacterium]|jgi:CheY-like chemotaxis protein|nr:hypothetical protein [Verrucomicrobiae bacterium]